MKKLNAAIVGCGSISSVHIDAIKKTNVTLYCVCDKDEVLAKKVALDHECKYYSDFEKMLEDEKIDVVHICTPHYLHVPMIKKCVEYGKHVFSEKPLGMNEKECLEAAKLSAIKNTKAGVCLQNRVNPTSIKLKQLIEQEVYGKVLGIRGLVTWQREANYYESSEWRGKKEYEGGGLLMNQMIHTLDLMQWFGGEMNQIKGKVSNRTLEGVIDEEDTAEATIWFKNGARGVFYATNAYTMNSSVLLEVQLEKAMLRILDDELTLIKENKKQVIATNRAAEKGKSYWGVSHETLIKQFYQAVENDHDNYIGLKEGIIGVKMCQDIYLSSESSDK